MRPRLLAGALLCVTALLDTSSGRNAMSAAFAAPEGTVVAGTARDSIGHPLPGVSVIVLAESGGAARRTTTERDGTYQVDGLPEGTYRVDFSLPGFTGVRQNHVRRVSGSPAFPPVDAALSVRPLCECIGVNPPPRMITGQVIDESGRPLPHARLERKGRNAVEIAYADGEGRFSLGLPSNGTWSLVVSDSGFDPVGDEIFATTAGPVVVRLRFVSTRAVPDTESFDRGCPCYQYLSPGER